jgi:hypothetical protein
MDVDRRWRVREVVGDGVRFIHDTGAISNIVPILESGNRFI